MTGADEDASLRAIELCRKLQRSASEEFERRGIATHDVAVGSLFATFDTVARHQGPICALEWLRTGLDLMERQLMQGNAQ